MPNYYFAEVEKVLTGTPEHINSVRATIEGNLSATFSTTQLNANAFLMNGKQDPYQAEEKTFKIFINHGFPSEGEIQALEGITINGIPLKAQVYLPISGSTLGKVLTADNGKALVELRPDLHQACVLFDVFEESQEKQEELIEQIMAFIHDKYVKPLTTMFSWKYSESKELLTSQVSVIMKEEQETQIREIESKINNDENKVKDYIRNLGNIHRQIITNRNKLQGLKDGSHSIESTFCQDLDLILTLDKVEDLQIKNGIFHIFTKDLLMHHDKDDRMFYLGKFRIEVDPKQSRVKFFNLNNTRKGYWTDKDNHPHVKSSGEACIGNMGAIIAELCAQMQFYPLITQLIDFLENVNTDDSAGRTVTNWDECDKNGKIIKKVKRG